MRFVLVLFLLLTSSLSAADYAVLIGVGEHDHPRAADLWYCQADVDAVLKILTTRAEVPQRNILRMTDNSPEKLRPTLANWRREIPAFLKRVGRDDRLIVFFGGHGVDADRTTYLAPRDVDPTRVPQTALKIDELQTWLAESPAKLEFLILDCCHAGKNNAVRSLEAEEVARAIDTDELPGTVVLASCRYREQSLEWAERGHGLFTYWLCRALEGAAADGDGQVTIGEVNKYVGERVKQLSPVVAEAGGHTDFKRQTPVVYGEVAGDPVLLNLSPESRESFCRRIAEDIDADVRMQKLDSVGLLEFFYPSGGIEEELKAALLPKALARTITAELRTLAGDDYDVTGAEAMQNATRDLLVTEIRTPAALATLNEKGAGDGLVFGVLRNLKTKLSLECSLIASDGGETLGRAAGVLRMTDTDQGNLGHNADLRRAYENALTPRDPDRLEAVFERAGRAHPLRQVDYPFGVTFFVNGRKREPSAFVRRLPGGGVRDDLVLQVEKGDRIAIDVRSRYRDATGTARRVGMRLLLDGINSLGQRPCLLDEGPLWVLQPDKEYRIDGWYLPRRGVRTNYERRPFEVVDVSDSVARRERFTEQVGLISFAFFEEVSGDGRSVAIGEGSDFTQEKLTTTKFKIGRCLGYFHLHYIDPQN